MISMMKTLFSLNCLSWIAEMCAARDVCFDSVEYYRQVHTVTTQRIRAPNLSFCVVFVLPRAPATGLFISAAVIEPAKRIRGLLLTDGCVLGRQGLAAYVRTHGSRKRFISVLFLFPFDGKIYRRHTGPPPVWIWRTRTGFTVHVNASDGGKFR